MGDSTSSFKGHFSDIKKISQSISFPNLNTLRIRIPDIKDDICQPTFTPCIKKIQSITLPLSEYHNNKNEPCRNPNFCRSISAPNLNS